MNIAELSHVSMECENEEANISSIEMDDFEAQPVARAQNRRGSNEPEADDVINIDDVIDGDVMSCDVREPGESIADDMNLAGEDCKFGLNAVSDVIPKNSGDVMESELNSFPARRAHVTMDSRRYSATKQDSWEYKKENMDVCQGVLRDNNGDEALVQRACAAMERADRLVRESCMEKGGSVNKRIGTSLEYLHGNHVDKYSSHLDRPLNHVDSSWNHVDKRRDHVGKGLFHVDKSWHPIDMSTPLVSEKPQNKPQDVNTHVRRSLDTDSYDNLLNSFANSKLESRSLLPHGESVRLGRGKTAEFTNREQCRESRITRSLSDIGKPFSSFNENN